MAKEFDLAHEINLHYKNTAILHKRRSDQNFTPIIIHYAEPLSQFSCRICCKKFGSDSTTEKVFRHYVKEDLETSHEPDSPNIFKFSYPYRRCVNISDSFGACVLYRSTKRQWLWGLAASNTTFFSVSKNKKVLISINDSEILNNIFFPEPFSLITSLTKIKEGYSTAEAISNHIILRRSSSSWKKNIEIFYKKYNIGVVDDTNTTAIIPKKLDYLKDKLNMFDTVKLM